MGEEVEHRGHVSETACVRVVRCADTQRHHHECYLRDCGEGKHPLDVGLRTCHHCGIERCECAYVCYKVQHFGSISYEEGEHSRHEIDSGNHHGSCVYERRHRCGALHCVGQPDVQGEHGTLAGSADEHKAKRHRQHCSRCSKQPCIGCERECACVVSVEEDSDKEEEVGKACNDERFLGGGYRSLLSIVEAYEQIGRHAHKFPEYIHLEYVCGNDKPQHRECKERQEGIVALEALLALHVAEGVDVHHQAYCAYDNEHHHRDGVKHYAHVYMQAVGKGQPCEVVGCERGEEPVGTTACAKIERCCGVGEQSHCGERGCSYCSGNLMRHFHARKGEHHKTEQWQCQYKYSKLHNR